MRGNVVDDRYITLGGHGISTYKNLTSGAEYRILGIPETGIGVIDTDD